MVYELDYTGKRIKLDIRPEELQIYSNPERVLIIIIKKIFHRIYIWNGSESQLRNKIISSRVAQDIQRDLNQKDRDYKIISIDQGSEPSKFFEFLKRLFLKHQRTCSLCGKKGSPKEIQEVFYRSHPRDIAGPRILPIPKYLCRGCRMIESSFDRREILF